MNVLDRILELRLERNWSEYRLSEESGISQTTISSWYRKNICPTVSSLEKICDAYHITLSQFFNYNNQFKELTEQQSKIVCCFNKLTYEQQKSLLEFLSTL